MIIFLLGLITGLLIAILFLLTLFYFKTPIERTLNQTQSRLKQKGSIIDPTNDDLDNWLETLPKQ